MFAGGALLGLVVFVIVAIITGLLATIGIVRFARTGSMGEAFNIGEILATIGKIGWGSYILAMVVLVVVQCIIAMVISVLYLIPVLGIIVEIIFLAPISIFEARYICQLYDAAGTACKNLFFLVLPGPVVRCKPKHYTLRYQLFFRYVQRNVIPCSISSDAPVP